MTTGAMSKGRAYTEGHIKKKLKKQAYSLIIHKNTSMLESVEITNKMQPCTRIHYSNVY